MEYFLEWYALPSSLEQQISFATLHLSLRKANRTAPPATTQLTVRKPGGHKTPVGLRLTGNPQVERYGEIHQWSVKLAELILIISTGFVSRSCIYMIYIDSLTHSSEQKRDWCKFSSEFITQSQKPSSNFLACHTSPCSGQFSLACSGVLTEGVYITLP